MKTHSMYMHTLDGRPAVLERIGNRVQLYYALPRSVVKLRGSLGEIRREWNDCLESIERTHGPLAGEAINVELKRYGYVLVEVPR